MSETTEHPSSQLVHTPSGAMIEMPADPTIEQILFQAVTSGADVATLERLVALKERVDAQKSERALDAALVRFRKACPQILKTREVYGKAKDDRPAAMMYRYANLEDVKASVTEPLEANDLNYSWDTEVIGGAAYTVCTLRHAGGGKRSSRFPVAAAGAPAMNGAQAAASAATYGQRYSLLAVLGITADLDDDGRSANKLDAPEADPNAATAGTREQRSAEQAAAKASHPTSLPADKPVHPVEAMKIQWQEWADKPKATKEDFKAWIRKLMVDPSLKLDSVKDFTPAIIEMCKKEMAS